MHDENELRPQTELLQEIKKESERERIRALVNHYLALVAMTIALMSTAIAGLGGLLGLLSAQWTGAIAFLPATISLIATNMKFTEKSRWHYRKMYRLAGLQGRLLFEDPEVPITTKVSDISKERTRILDEMHEDWNRNLDFDWKKLSKK